MKVFLVQLYDIGAHRDWPEGIFDSREKAEFYIKENPVENGDAHEITEFDLQ